MPYNVNAPCIVRGVRGVGSGHTVVVGPLLSSIAIPEGHGTVNYCKKRGGGVRDLMRVHSLKETWGSGRGASECSSSRVAPTN